MDKIEKLRKRENTWSYISWISLGIFIIMAIISIIGIYTNEVLGFINLLIVMLSGVMVGDNESAIKDIENKKNEERKLRQIIREECVKAKKGVQKNA